MRLRTRIGASMAAVTLAAVAVTGLLTNWRITRTIHEEADRRLMDATGTLDGEWRALSNSVSAAVAGVAQSPGLRGPLSRLALGTLPAESREFISAARLAREKTDLEFLQVFDERGVVLSNGHWQVFYGRPDPTGWEIVERRGTAPVAHWRQVRGERLLALETSVRVEMAGRIFQVVGGKAVTMATVERIGLRTGGSLYLQAGDGTRIVPTGTAPQDVQHLARARVVEEAGFAVVVGRAPTGEAAGISLYPIRQPDGTVLGDFVLRISQARLNELARAVSWTFVWIGAGGIVMAWVFGFWMARRLMRPVEKLALAARHVGVGRTPGPMPRITADEVGDLVRSFQQMTTDLTESRRQLVQAERIGAWREIAQHLAHEIKNALSPIQISVETIQRGHRAGRADLDEIVAESVKTVRDEVEGLRNLVNEFSQFARMPELSLVPGPVNAVLEHAAALHDKNPRGVSVIRTLAPGLPAVARDPEALGRALGNIILNAVEASPPGAPVTVSSGLTGEGQVEILIDDRGPGVPAGAREKVFEPYYTTKEGGTGLGLAMAYKIVAEHGGRIEIPDLPDGGSRFRILLPPAPGEGGPEAEA